MMPDRTTADQLCQVQTNFKKIFINERVLICVAGVTQCIFKNCKGLTLLVVTSGGEKRIGAYHVTQEMKFERHFQRS